MSEEVGDWDAAYSRAAPPGWDIQRPQPVFRALADAGALAGDVLDAGCGTGEHTLLAARCGARATGVDLSARAIERARSKAAAQGLAARFEAGDVLTMELTGPFDVVLDSGLFHVFNDEDRGRYVQRLHGLLRPGGRLYLMCFSDRQPGDWGPRRVRREELAAAFADGWEVERIEAVRFETNPIPEMDLADGVAAWLAELVAR